jgi:hypothetical protein
MTGQELMSERRTLDEMLAWGAAQPDDDYTRFTDELVEAAFTAGRGELVLELDLEDEDVPEQPAEPDSATFGGGFYRP